MLFLALLVASVLGGADVACQDETIAYGVCTATDSCANDELTALVDCQFDNDPQACDECKTEYEQIMYCALGVAACDMEALNAAYTTCFITNCPQQLFSNEDNAACGVCIYDNQDCNDECDCLCTACMSDCEGNMIPEGATHEECVTICEEDGSSESEEDTECDVCLGQNMSCGMDCDCYCSACLDTCAGIDFPAETTQEECVEMCETEGSSESEEDNECDFCVFGAMTDGTCDGEDCDCLCSTCFTTCDGLGEFDDVCVSDNAGCVDWCENQDDDSWTQCTDDGTGDDDTTGDDDANNTDDSSSSVVALYVLGMFGLLAVNY